MLLKQPGMRTQSHEQPSQETVGKEKKKQGKGETQSPSFTIMPTRATDH